MAITTPTDNRIGEHEIVVGIGSFLSRLFNENPNEFEINPFHEFQNGITHFKKCIQSWNFHVDERIALLDVIENLFKKSMRNEPFDALTWMEIASLLTDLDELGEWLFVQRKEPVQYVLSTPHTIIRLLRAIATIRVDRDIELLQKTAKKLDAYKNMNNRVTSEKTKQAPPEDAPKKSSRIYTIENGGVRFNPIFMAEHPELDRTFHFDDAKIMLEQYGVNINESPWNSMNNLCLLYDAGTGLFFLKQNRRVSVMDNGYEFMSAIAPIVPNASSPPGGWTAIPLITFEPTTQPDQPGIPWRFKYESLLSFNVYAQRNGLKFTGAFNGE